MNDKQVFIETHIQEHVVICLTELYDYKTKPSAINIQQTKPEFEGDISIVVFPYVRFSKKKPEDTALEIGELLIKKSEFVISYSVVKGFLNLSISNDYYYNVIKNIIKNPDLYGKCSANNNRIVIEYSSPNTNKPLHLGHIRNNLLGWSIAEILKEVGFDVIKVNLINNRGIHICKSMLGYMKWGNNEEPTQEMRGDKMIGKYYVMFEQAYKKEVENLKANGIDEKQAKAEAPLLKEAQNLLQEWEAGNSDVLKLWHKLNKWVYEGFDYTYKRLGIDFDKTYYESDTYLKGKDVVNIGLDQNTCYKQENNSIWISLKDENLDDKLLLRGDGTSVYITQDIGTAIIRNKDYNPQKMMYIVGNEQIHHFKVLKAVLKKLGHKWADTIEHVSYGMVELPDGKMKTREGKVVDADDLMDSMYITAKEKTTEIGKATDYNISEADELYKILSLGALKFFILKVDAKKNMLFNPNESIDFNGHTGPFVQYAYARIKSILRKADIDYQNNNADILKINLQQKEKELLKKIEKYPAIIKVSAKELNPSIIANYVYELAKMFNQFYHDLSILKETDNNIKVLRLQLAQSTAIVLQKGMQLLGCKMPERM